MSRPAPQLPTPAAIDFGAPSAERDIERGLEEYFVESEAYNRVRSGAKRIVVGNRGIGKSAIFQVLARRERDDGCDPSSDASPHHPVTSPRRNRAWCRSPYLPS